MVAPFDRERLQLTGAPIAAEFEVVQAIGFGNTNADSGAGQFAASAGVMAYLPGGSCPRCRPRSGGSTATDASSPLALRHARCARPAVTRWPLRSHERSREPLGSLALRPTARPPDTRRYPRDERPNLGAANRTACGECARRISLGLSGAWRRWPATLHDCKKRFRFRLTGPLTRQR